MRMGEYMAGSPPAAMCKQVAGIQLVQIPYGVGHILGDAVVAAVGGGGGGGGDAVAVAVAVAAVAAAAVVGSCE